ncbi:hypothetical protein CMQ_7869 [Grosmannia clavigera kw1407]|uniref:Uncharacterized protein n=1 Tax=Grosmannia clavigera (strain kw1407 / UAMH 11150) TaxID=655863 RepID=F0XS37_GROCL|nr:uncharacterized protein CMQ_7869 [Grosmannia clavigera kw1407]EFW99501.1 hypothetical protein CMQ_7869 [Grosmannia clavigera kw1407]
MLVFGQTGGCEGERRYGDTTMRRCEGNRMQRRRQRGRAGQKDGMSSKEPGEAAAVPDVDKPYHQYGQAHVSCSAEYLAWPHNSPHGSRTGERHSQPTSSGLAGLLSAVAVPLDPVSNAEYLASTRTAQGPRGSTALTAPVDCRDEHVQSVWGTDGARKTEDGKRAFLGHDQAHIVARPAQTRQEKEKDTKGAQTHGDK